MAIFIGALSRLVGFSHLCPLSTSSLYTGWSDHMKEEPFSPSKAKGGFPWPQRQPRRLSRAPVNPLKRLAFLVEPFVPCTFFPFCHCFFLCFEFCPTSRKVIRSPAHTFIFYMTSLTFRVRLPPLFLLGEGPVTMKTLALFRWRSFHRTPRRRGR